ncbi:DUF1570 domain-containing protein [Phycisphaerales bacterium AB-hyl4]|uniref:DUF1570 domain-containing protein n=1 Tax=Natronomicrosphaera hydrolytica TaxID=3242702 RepID=A0ABV4UBC0_9BACT
MFARRFTLLCIAVVLTFITPAVAQPSLDTWDSRYYTIHTNLPREDVIEYAQHMDLIYAEFERRFAHMRDRRRVDQPLYLLATQRDYLAFLATMGIDGTNSGGMFFHRGARGGLASYVDRPDRAQAFATLRHEAFHQFAHNYLGATLPTSINEGIAQYFENIVIVDGQIRTGLADRARIEQVRRMIDEGRTMPLDTLLNISNQQWAATLRTNPAAASDLYAQSWSLVYFLVHADRRFRDAFERYLAEIGRGLHSRQAMQRAFDTDDFSVAEDAWQRFAMNLEPDPVTTTQAHLEFLGEGMVLLLQRDGELPRTFHRLRNELRSRGFRTHYHSHAIQFHYDAADDHVFQYERAPGRWEDFEMIDPAGPGEPPRLLAPRARWRPMLVWDQDSDGNLVYDVVFQGGR